MLKTVSVASPTNKNPKQGGQGIEVKDQGEKKLTQKKYKGQKTAKLKK